MSSLCLLLCWLFHPVLATERCGFQQICADAVYLLMAVQPVHFTPPAAFFIAPESQPVGTNNLRLFHRMTFHHHVTVVSMTVTTVLWAAALETLVRWAHADSLACVSYKCSHFGACKFSKGRARKQKVLPVSLTPRFSLPMCCGGNAWKIHFWSLLLAAN